MPARKHERTKVFVSYSRQDKAWLERLRVHLKPLQREMEIDIWDDSNIQPGKKWKEEITNAINSTKVAVLLVSANFLASDFIATGEVPPLLNAAQKDGAIIVPLILSPSRFTKTDIAEFESINEPSEPLVNMTWGRQEEVLDQLAAFIENAFTASANRKAPAKAVQVPAVPQSPAGKQTRPPQDIPQFNALIAEIRLRLEETLWEPDMAEIGTQVTGTILVEGLQAIARKTHPTRLARNLLQTVEVASAQIVERSKPLDSAEAISQFIRFQSGDQEITNVISLAIEKVGRNGVIVIEPGRLLTLDIVEGMQFDRGYLASEFITDHQKKRVVIRNPHILLCEKEIRSDDISPIVGKLTSIDEGRLVVIAPDVEEEALAALIANPNLNTVAVKAPGFGDRRKAILEDIAILTGGTVMSSEGELLEVDVDHLGMADKIDIDADNTTIIGGKGATWKIEARVKEIRAAIEETASDYDREKLQERLEKLVGGVAVIRAGGGTEQERQKRTDLFERILRLYYSALWEGVVPGEHLALVNAATKLRELKLSGEEQVANSILALALETPLQRMAEGLGRSGEETLLTIRSAQKQKRNRNIGYYGDENSFVDLVKAGAIVPTRNVVALVKSAVQLAADKLASSRYTDELVRQLSSS